MAQEAAPEAVRIVVQAFGVSPCGEEVPGVVAIIMLLIFSCAERFCRLEPAVKAQLRMGGAEGIGTVHEIKHFIADGSRLFHTSCPAGGDKLLPQGREAVPKNLGADLGNIGTPDYAVPTVFQEALKCPFQYCWIIRQLMCNPPAMEAFGGWTVAHENALGGCSSEVDAVGHGLPEAVRAVMAAVKAGEPLIV